MNEIKDIYSTINEKMEEYKDLKSTYDDIRKYMCRPDEERCKSSCFDPSYVSAIQFNHNSSVAAVINDYINKHEDKMLQEEADRLFVMSVDLEKEIRRMIEEFKHEELNK